MSRFNQLCLGFILNCPVCLFAQEIEYRDGDTTPVVYRDISKIYPSAFLSKFEHCQSFDSVLLNAIHDIEFYDVTCKFH